MFTAFDSRQMATEKQLSIIMDIISNAVDNGFSSIDLTEEYDEEPFTEVVTLLLKNGYDIIHKKYPTYIATIVSWKDGKKENGNEVTLDYSLSESNSENSTVDIIIIPIGNEEDTDEDAEL